MVSTPWAQWFEERSRGCRERVLPPSVRARVAIEGGIDPAGYRFTEGAGRVVSLEHPGAPAGSRTRVAAHGLTPDHVAAKARESLGAARG
ncbi:transketolase-like TK C-terminal-containing protein [Streptomyces adustus]